MAHFPDIIIPGTISYGSSTGPTSLTDIVTNVGGFRKTNRFWDQFLRAFQLGYNVRTPEKAAIILSIWEALGGPADSCLIRDHNDWNTTFGSMGSNGLASITKDDQPLRNTVDNTFLGDGTTKIFQMTKVRTQGSATHTRIIKQPQILLPAPLVAISGVLKTLTTDYTINANTGIVTFVVAPAGASTPTWGGAFYVPVAFVNDEFLQQLTTFDLTSIPNIEMREVRL